jgi:Domain of unknown function (DUF4136)
MLHRRFALALTLIGPLLAAGCASINMLRAEVTTFGEWPAGRSGGRYAFERLPSQQAMANEQSALEAAAEPALAAAGLQAAAAGQEPDVLVQLGRRVARSGVGPWDDPLWWHGGFGAWRHGPWRGPYWGFGMQYSSPRYELEVAVLLRDRASGKPLYEARASIDSYGTGTQATVEALYRAALTDFPKTGLNPRMVAVPVGPAASAPR